MNVTHNPAALVVTEMRGTALSGPLRSGLGTVSVVVPS